jgi:3-phosphoshikimate 1-carboxyvinyltransferase
MSHQSMLRVDGTLRMPGDKSISHRALMLAALAPGTSRLRGLLLGDDVQSTARVLRALGVRIPDLGAEVSFSGGRPFTAPSDDLDCGNSGTTARLIAGILAGQSVVATLNGDESLSRRPMRRVADPLRQLGATIDFLAGGEHLPMRVTGGPLRSQSFELAIASAQVKSAILLAALVGRTAVRVREPSRSRDHTERMMRALGCTMTEGPDGIALSPGGVLAALDMQIPGDPSSAAYFVALGCLAGHGAIRVAGVSLNPTRTAFVDVLCRMGGAVVPTAACSEFEPFGDLYVSSPSRLRGTVLSGEEVPRLIDEIPLLACVAARAEGETLIRDAGELRVKESDRIAATVSNLRALGAEAHELADGLVVVGSDRPLSGRVTTFGDHRIAMAFGVLGALPGNAIALDDPDCVRISYPDFWSDLARVID